MFWNKNETIDTKQDSEVVFGAFAAASDEIAEMAETMYS